MRQDTHKQQCFFGTKNRAGLTFIGWLGDFERILFVSRFDSLIASEQAYGHFYFLTHFIVSTAYSVKESRSKCDVYVTRSSCASCKMPETEQDVMPQ